jgi:putative Holliday junction resolvase
MNGVLLGFDVGTRRIGVAKAEVSPRIAFAYTTLKADSDVARELQRLVKGTGATGFVVGLPRHQTGEESTQSAYTRQWVSEFLEPFELPIAYYDESTTSLMARERLEELGRPYKPDDIDAMAAQIILESYLEQPARSKQ